MLTTATGQITGGIILGLLDIISQKMGFGYKGVYNGESYYNNGTVGGAYGEVERVEYGCTTRLYLIIPYRFSRETMTLQLGFQ